MTADIRGDKTIGWIKMKISRGRIVGLLLALSVVGVVWLRGEPDGGTVNLRLGDNAYVIQQTSGFPLGYPTRPMIASPRPTCGAG